MLAVRTLARQRLVPLLGRTNATLTAAGTSAGDAPPPIPADVSAKVQLTPRPKAPVSREANAAPATPASDEAAEDGDGEPKRRRRIVKKRAQISLTNPRKWNPPMKPGLLPVYDEALKLISEDSARLRAELAEVRARAVEVEKALESEGKEGETREALEEELRALRKKVGILEIQCDINRPSVRWSAANGMADLTKPVYRRLVEQKWRNYGTLDLLMERIYQMSVVPDLLPSVRPTIDLRLSFPEPPPLSTYLRTRTKRKYKPVEPGIYLAPEQTRRAPRLYTSVFHPETRYYTLVLVDADVPDPENESFTTYLHWLQPNIPLSASTCGHLVAHPHTRYVPPHPQRGSPYHRYCVFLLPHVNAEQKINVAAVGDGERRGFDLRAFCEEHGLDAGQGGAAHMWREVWDETVSDIYKHTLKQAEPRYGTAPRADPYAEVKGLKKFAT
ncbi:hypothetical protein M0805_007145 [Coniferiporia weirii]|nr:hypothetical protein M0805_007145 [Coniferiporia weirii]